MLSYNLADLLRSAPGTSERHAIAVDGLPIAEGVELAGPVEGEVRFTTSGRSVLVQGRLTTALAEPCSRCLEAARAAITVEIEDEALPSVELDSGTPLQTGSEPDVLRLDDHHELDLEPLIRDAISLAEPIAPLCRPDCRGLCEVCGADRNADPDHAHAADDVDPRLAALAVFREQLQ